MKEREKVITCKNSRFLLLCEYFVSLPFPILLPNHSISSWIQRKERSTSSKLFSSKSSEKSGCKKSEKSGSIKSKKESEENHSCLKLLRKRSSLKSILKTTNTISQQNLCPDDGSEGECDSSSFCCDHQPRAAFQEPPTMTSCTDSPGTKSLSSYGQSELPILDPLLSRVVLTPKKRKSQNQPMFQHFSEQNFPQNSQNFSQNSSPNNSSGLTNLQSSKLTPNKLKMHQNNLFTKNINQELDQSPGKISTCSSVVTCASSSDLLPYKSFTPNHNPNHSNHHSNHHSSANGSMELLWDTNECLELTHSQPNHGEVESTPSTSQYLQYQANDHFPSFHPTNHHHSLAISSIPSSSRNHFSSSQNQAGYSGDNATFAPSFPTTFSHLNPFLTSRDTHSMSSGNISFVSATGKHSFSSLRNNPNENSTPPKNGTIDHDDELEWDNYDCDFIDDDHEDLNDDASRERY